MTILMQKQTIVIEEADFFVLKFFNPLKDSSNFDFILTTNSKFRIINDHPIEYVLLFSNITTSD